MENKHPEPEKAYKNLEFLNSSDARIIRMLAEFLEPMQRLGRRGDGFLVPYGRIRFRLSYGQNLPFCFPY